MIQRAFQNRSDSKGSERGATHVEHLILLVTVAIGFAAAAVPLGALLLGYHEGIEVVLALPVP